MPLDVTSSETDVVLSWCLIQCFPCPNISRVSNGENGQERCAQKKQTNCDGGVTACRFTVIISQPCEVTLNLVFIVPISFSYTLDLSLVLRNRILSFRFV